MSKWFRFLTEILNL